jgi:hypothetical protein
MKLTLTNPDESLNNTKTGNIAFLIFLMFYSVYLIFLANKLGLSYDEPYSLHTSANKLSEVIRLSYQFEFQPPGYFLILSLWRKLNEGIFFARLLSLIFTFFSAFFLYKVIRLIFNNIYSKWIVVLFLLNPFTVWSSMEIRLYSFIVLLAILSFYLFYLIYFFQKNNLKLFFVIISTVGVYTQYFFVFLIISFAVVLFLRKEWSSFFNYILLSFLIALLFIPNLFFIREQFNASVNTITDYTIYERFKSVVLSSLEFFISKSSLGIGSLGRWALRIGFISLYIITFYNLYKSKISEKGREFINLRYMVILTIFPLFCFIIFFSLTNLIFDIKYLSIAFPFHILLLSAFGIYEKKIRNIFYFLYSVFFLLLLLNYPKSNYVRSQDYKSVAEYIEKIKTENEPVLFINNDLSIGFKQYYKKECLFITLPEIQFNYNAFSTHLQDTTELSQLIKNIRSDSPSFLTITKTDLAYLYKRELTNNIIDSYLINNFIIPVDTTFEGFHEYDFVRLRRIIRKYP